MRVVPTSKNRADKCEKCHEHIPADTDDNYNSDHTQIKCPSCGHWQSAEGVQNCTA